MKFSFSRVSPRNSSEASAGMSVSERISEPIKASATV